MAQPSPFLLSAVMLIAAAAARPLSAQAPQPTRMSICESRDNACNRPDARFDNVWVFNGAEGEATAANATTTHLSIEKFDSDSIVVRRTGVEGLTAVYTGAVHGTHINGTVQWYWPDHSGYPASGFFAATLQDQLAASATVSTENQNVLPPQLLVCQNGLCNGAWVLSGSEGTGTWFVPSVARAKLTVIRSSPDDILIRRTDSTDGVSATYAGSLRGDHYSGTVIWSTPDHSGESSGTWSAAVPQTSCAGHPAMDIPEAKRIGQNALMFHHDREALDCYVLAAEAGDAMSQAAVGLTYYQGRKDIPQDYVKALFWLRKAADQGLYAAQRTVAEMYTAGQGTPRDPAAASIYTARADEQKHDLERRQDLAEHEADRRTQLLSSLILGVSFGAALMF